MGKRVFVLVIPLISIDIYSIEYYLFSITPAINVFKSFKFSLI